MKKLLILNKKKAQIAVEYLILLTTVVAIVLIGFKTYMPGFEETANVYYNRVVPGILGDPPNCGDGACCDAENLNNCWIDCNASSEPCP